MGKCGHAGPCFCVAVASLLYVNPALSWIRSGRLLYPAGACTHTHTHVCVQLCHLLLSPEDALSSLYLRAAPAPSPHPHWAPRRQSWGRAQGISRGQVSERMKEGAK